MAELRRRSSAGTARQTIAPLAMSTLSEDRVDDSAIADDDDKPGAGDGDGTDKDGDPHLFGGTPVLRYRSSSASRAISRIRQSFEISSSTPVPMESLRMITSRASEMAAVNPLDGVNIGLVALTGREGEMPSVPEGAVLPGPDDMIEEHLPPPLPKLQMVLLVIAMMLTYFTGAASVSATTLLLPKIAEDLGTTQLATQWVVSAYTLAYGCVLMVSGRFADMYGRKMLFCAGLGIAALFSVLSGVIRNYIVICVMRAMVGLGLAIASPAGFGIIGVTFREDPERSIAFAAFGLGGPVGAATGTLIGGAVADISRRVDPLGRRKDLTSSRGWTYLFYIMAVLALIPLLLGLWIIPNDRRDLRRENMDRRVDWLGCGLITAAIFLLSFGLTSSGQVEKGWHEPCESPLQRAAQGVPTMIAISIVLFIAFGFWEHHLEHRTTLPPVVKMSLFSRHGWKFTAINFSAFAIAFSVYSLIYSFAIYYQDYQGLSALQNAIRLIPSNVSGALAAGAIMYLAPRFRAPWLMSAGCIFSGIASLLFIVQPNGTRYWYCEFWGLILFPPGMDFTVCLGNVMISNLVEEDEQSVAGALWQLMMQISGVLGVCVASLIITERQKATGDLLTALKATWWMQVAWAWTAVVVTTVALRRVKLAQDIVERKPLRSAMTTPTVTRMHSRV